MPVLEEKESDWKKCQENNQDPYGKCCVDIAREVMRMLDERPGDFDCHSLITEGEKAVGTEGITGFMAGCIAQMVSGCHSRGDEFRRKWNLDTQIGTEGEKANEKGTVLNPAVVNIG